MTTDFVPQPTPTPPEQDLFADLLAAAVENQAKKQAEDAIKKGFVIREDLNAALIALSTRLETTLVEKITSLILPQVNTTVQTTVDQMGIRKGTIPTPADEFEANPVAYLLTKAQKEGPESYTQVEKDIIWGLTYHALSKGLEEGNE